MPAKIKRSKCT